LIWFLKLIRNKICLLCCQKRWN